MTSSPLMSIDPTSPLTPPAHTQPPADTTTTTPHLTDTDQSRIDDLVLLYLSKRGYNRAADQFKSELQQKSDTNQPPAIPTTVTNHKLIQSVNELAFSTQLSVNTQVLKQLISYNSTDISPENLIHQYDSLLTWINKCLQIYRVELDAALYPLYVHTYVHLVEHGFVSAAGVFARRYRSSINNKFTAELDHITSITTKQQLKLSELVHFFIHKKFELYMSEYSYNLLVSFIEEHNYMWLLKVLNNNTNVKIISKKPNFLTFADLAASRHHHPRHQLNDTIRQYVASVQRIDKPVQWGILSDYAELQKQISERVLNDKLQSFQSRNDKSAELTALKADEAAVNAELNDEVDKLSSRNKAKKMKERNDISAKIHDIESAKQAEIDALKQSIAGQIPAVKQMVQRTDETPLPALSEADKHNITQDLLLRAKLSSTQLPSILQISVLNQAYAVTSVTVNTDCTLCCVTLTDCTSRLYYMSTDKQPAVLTGHTGPVYKAAFSPDSQYLLTCSSDCTARLYHVPTLTCPVVYKGHNYPVWSVTFSALGFYFVTASHDRTARLWSTDKIYPLRLFIGHVADVECVAFHPNQMYVATGSGDTTIRMWDIHTGDCVRVFTGHTSAVLCVTFSACGQYICSGSEAGTILVHNIDNSKLAAEWSNSTIPPTDVELSQAGITGQLPDTELHIPHQSAVTSVSYSADNALIASCGLDKTVKLWSTKKYASSGTSHLQTYYTHQTQCTYVGFTPRNLLVAAGVYHEQTV